MRESVFQRNLKNELKERYPDCIITKMDANIIQGIPDMLILFNNKWATLEIKKNSKANIQPNQKYYVDKMNTMSFSRIIYPENKEKVLEELDSYFF